MARLLLAARESDGLNRARHARNVRIFMSVVNFVMLILSDADSWGKTGTNGSSRIVLVEP